MAENSNINSPNDGLSLSSPVSYSSKENNDIIDSLREATVAYDPDSKIDIDSIKFIDNQAEAINRNSPVNPVRFNAPYPGNVSNNRNPFSNQTGQFDLRTSQGRRDYLGGIGQKIQNKVNDIPHGGLWKNPVIFGKKQMNADRYMSHSKFSDLGFHPFVDNETYYNQNSTAWDDLSRTSSAFTQMFKPAFTSGWRTLRNTLSGDPFKQDYEGAEAMRDAMRIASSTRGGVTGFMNDLYLNSSYTFGIVSSMFVEEAALAFMGGYALPHLAAVRNAGRFKQLFNVADGIGTGAKTVGNYSADLLRSVGATDKAKDFYNYARGSKVGESADWMVRQLMPETTKALQTINSTKNTANNLSNLAKVNKTFGGFYRDVRMFNVAWAESRLEGGLRELESTEEAYMMATKKNKGEDLTDEQWELIRNASKSAGLKTALMNFPIIFLSNKFVLDTALRGFKPLGRMLQESKAGLGRRIMRTGKVGKTAKRTTGQTLKEGDKAFRDLGTGSKRAYAEGLKGGLLGLGAFGVKYMQANLAEGFQELAQETVSAGVGDYYNNLLDDVLSDSINMNSAELEDRVKAADASWMKSMKAGMQSDSVSFETFMSGFLMGGLVQPFQTMMFEHMPNMYRKYSDREAFDAYAAKKKEYAEMVVDRMDEMWNDPTRFLDITKLNALNQRQFNVGLVNTSYKGDVMSFIDTQDQSEFSHIYTMLQHNKAGDFKAHIEAFQNMNDADLVDAFENSDETAPQIRKKFKGIIEKIDQIQENYNNFNDKYVNPFDPNNFENGTRIHQQEAIRYQAFEHAKMVFLFQKHAYERGVERMNSIVQAIKADPVIDTLDASDIDAFVDISLDPEMGGIKSATGLNQQIAILEDEVSIPLAKNAKKDLKQIRKNKEKKLEILKEYKKEIFNSANYKISGSEKNKEGEKIPKYSDKLKVSGKNKLKSIFIEYLNHIQNTNGGQIKDNDGIDKAFEMILDYRALNGRTRDFYKVQQILDNPETLNTMAERIAVAMNQVWKHHKKKTTQRQKITKFMDQQERGKIISDLARKGIYTNVEDAEIFVKSGAVADENLPLSFVWYSENSRVTLDENPKTFMMIAKVLGNYAKQKEAEAKSKEAATEEVEPVRSVVETGPLDVSEDMIIPAVGDTQEEDNITTPDVDTEGMGLPVSLFDAKIKDFKEFILNDASTYRMLQKLFAQYEYEVANLGKRDFINSELKGEDRFWAWAQGKKEGLKTLGGAPYVRARYELFLAYDRKSVSYKNKKTFDNYLFDNQGTQFFIQTVGKQGLKPTSILTETYDNESVGITETLEKDLKKGEKIVEKYRNTYLDSGIQIISKTVASTDGTKNTHYIIKTINGDNANDVFQGLPNAKNNLKPYYFAQGEVQEGEDSPGLALAVKAANWIKLNAPKKQVLDFAVDGKDVAQFNSGEVILDKDKNRYSVESVEDAGLKIKNLSTDKYTTIDPGTFKKEGWTRASEQKINPKIGKRKTKLKVNEPLQLYPYDEKSDLVKNPLGDTRSSKQKKIDRQLLQQNLDKTLQQLTQEQIDQLEIKIEKNPDYDKVMDMKAAARDEFPMIAGNPINEQLRLGASKYRVVLYQNKKVKGKIASTPLLVLQSPEDATLLDSEGNEINPLLITQEQAVELFYGAGQSDVSHIQIQDNYAAAFAMQDVFTKLLKESDTDIASITVQQLRENHQIHMSIGGGNFAYETAQRVYRTDKQGNQILQRDPDGTPMTTMKPAVTTIQKLADNGFTLGQGFSAKNRDKDDNIIKEPKYIVFDQMMLMEDEEVSMADPITNIDMGDPGTPEYKAYIRLIDKIQASMRGEGINLFGGTLGFPNRRSKAYNTLRSGRYIYFVFSPGIGTSGEFTAIQLKTKQKTSTQVHDIFNRLRDAMEVTSKSTKDGGNISINPKTKKRVADDNNFANNLINNELKEELFISAKPGQHITIGVNNFGDLEVNYYNSDAPTATGGLGWEIKIEYNKKEFDDIAKGNKEGVLKPEDLINHINKRLNKLVQSTDNIKKYVKLNNKNTKIPNLEVDIKVTGDNISFRNSLPKTISGGINNFKYLNENTEAIIGENVRSNVRSIMVSTDNTAMQIIKENAANLEAERAKPKETSKPEESTRRGLEDDSKWDELREDEFKNVDESILDDIAKEIAKNGKIKGDDPIANRKKEILNHPIPAIEINRKVEEIKTTLTNNEAVGKIDPSENQEEQKMLDDAKMSLKIITATKKKEYWTKRSDKESDQYIEDLGERRKQYLIDTNNDPEVLEAQKLVNDLTNDLNSKYKITKDFDGRDVEDINVFLDWLKKNLPDFIQVKDISDLASRLKNNGVTVGAFLTSLKVVAGKKEFIGEIYTDASSGFRYHEAFHAVFNLLLSDSEQVKYLKIAKKGKLAELRAEGISLKQALEDLKLMSPTYSKMTQQELENTLYEEWLADKFEEFKTNPQTTKVDSEVKSFFQRILDWIVSIFERTSIANARIELSQLDPTLHRLFKDIDSGKFKSSNFADNKYTQAIGESSGGISNTKFAIVKSIEQVKYEVQDINSPGDFVTKIRRIVIPMPAGEVDLMVRRIGALYQDLKEDWVPTKEQPSMIKSNLLKRAVDMFIDMHSIERSQYDKYDPMNDADALMIDKIVETHEALKKPENKKEIYNGVRQYLTIVENVEDTLSDDYIVEQEDAETPYDVNGKRNQQGGFNNLNEFVRSMFLSATTEIKDVYGNEYINSNAAPGEKKYKLKQSADYIKVFNGFLKGLSNESDPTQAIIKLYLFSESNNETNAVVSELFNKIYGNDGMKKIRDHIYKGSAFPQPLKGKSTLFQAILKAFDQYRVHYIKALRNISDNNVSLIEADKQNDENWQMQIWSDEFNTLRLAIKNDVAKGVRGVILPTLDNLNDLIAASELKSVAYLKERGLYYKKFFAEKLGIHISEKFIEYSIAVGKLNKDTLTDGNYIKNLIEKYSDQRPIEVMDEKGWSDIKWLRNALKENQNIYNEADNETYRDANDQAEKVTNAAEQTDGSNEGVFYRLQKWAQSNAAFDETIGSTVLYDSEGNYIYVFQVPTLHLKKSAEMNSAKGLKQFLSKNKYLKGNNLAENSKFAAISEAGKAGLIRMLGVKDTALIEKDGKMIENKALDINTLPGTSYGNLSFNQFIASVINMYGLNFNELKGDVTKLKDSDGKEFTFSPVLIRVLSESNISDFRNLPNVKVLKYSVNDSGDVIFTDEYLDKWKNRIKRKYTEIQENFKKLENGDRDNEPIIDNYNSIIDKKGNDILTLETLKETESDPTVARAYKFNFEVNGLLNIQRTPKENIIITEKDVLKPLTKLEEGRIKGNTNKQKVFLKGDTIKGLGERNKEATVFIGDQQYLVKYEGTVQSKDFEAEQLKQIVEDLGTDVVIKGKAEQSGFKYTFEIGDEIYSTNLGVLKYWFNPSKKEPINYKHKYRFIPIEEAKRQTSTSSDQIFDNTLKLWLEAQTKEGVSFEDAWDDFVNDPNNKNKITADEFMIEALNAQYERFDDMLVSTGAEQLVDEKLLKGKLPFGAESKVAAKGKKSLRDLYLTQSKHHNLRQIFFNNWLNTADINEFYNSNQAMSLKDSIDAGKRAKDRNAGGASAASTIAAPEFNINSPTKNFGVLTISDPLYKQRKGVDGKVKDAERMDGQGYLTINGFKRFWFGLGKLNKAQNSLIDRIEKGIPVTAEEFFGNIDKNSTGYKQNKNYVNSKKFVHADGNVYLKMSNTILSKELDSYAGTNGNKPLENKKKLWHLRKLAEDWENKNGGMPLMIVPRSASKMRKTNVLNPEMTGRVFSEPLTIGEQDGSGEFTKTGKILNDAVEILDANYLTLQQVTPSNKIEVVDPRQIKNIILSEQNDTDIVIINGEEITIGALRKMYEDSYVNRVKLSYLGRSSLIFNLPNALNAIEEAQRKGKITPDLQSFLDYAIAALETSQASTQQLEFFAQIREHSNPLNGQNKYELNSPFTIQKLTELMLGFFQKGVIGEKQPGKAVTLMSDYGVNVFKKVDAIDKNGTPIAWTVIRERTWQNMSEVEKKEMLKPNRVDQALEPEENADGNLTGLEVNQIYIDRLRHDVIDYKRNSKGKLMYKDGKLIDLKNVYTEFILPPHFAEEMSLDPNAPIPSVIANQFAVRIPSQDKHSAINLRLVDHLPVYMGSTGVFAHELLEISGADYDIDKVFIHHKEFYKNDEGDLVEYGKAKNLKDKFKEYITYSEKDMYKRGSNLFYARRKWLSRKRDEDSIIKKSVEDIQEEYASYVINNREVFVPGADVKKVKQKFAEEKGYDYDFKADEFEPVYVENDTREIVKGALSILNLPTDEAEYKNYIETGKGEPYAAAHSNDILDYKIALLGNNSMARPKGGRREAIKNEPAVDTLFSNIWKRWETENPKVYEKNNVKDLDINNLLGQYKIYKDSKEGSRNISAVVPINTVISWHRVYKSKLRKTENALPTLNGWTYDNYNLQYFIDPKESLKQGKDIQRKGEQDTRLQDAMSQLISIMVDNQKNPYSAKLGLNKHAAGIAANAIGLGIDVETVLLLINHPTIAEAYYRGLNKTEADQPGPMQILKKRLGKINKELIKKAKEINVSDEMLKKHSANFLRISDTEAKYKGEDASLNIVLEEIAIIQQLLNLNTIKEANENMVGIMSIEKGNLRDLNSIEEMQKNIDDLELNSSQEKYEKSNVPFGYATIQKIRNENGMIGNNIAMFNNLKKSVLPHLLITSSMPFSKLYNVMKGAMNPRLQRDQRLIGEQKFRKDLLSYLTIKAYMNDLSRNPKRWAQEKLSSLNNALIYDQMGDENSLRINKIVSDVKFYLKDQGKRNDFLDEFIKNLKATASENKTGVNVIKGRTLQKQTAKGIQELQSSFLELMGDPKTRLAADHMIHYLMVTHGLQPRFGSFHQVIVPIIMDVYLQNNTKVKELFARATNQKGRVNDAEFKSVFGMTFSEITKDITQWFESSGDTHLITSLSNVEKSSKKGLDSATSYATKDKGGVKSAVLFRSLKKEDDKNYQDEDDTLDINLGFNTKFLWKTEKGKRKRIRKSKWSKNKQVETNLKLIEDTGFKTELLPDSGDTVVLFPPVVRMKKEGDKKYTYYKLIGHVSPYGSEEVSDNIYDINEGQNTLYGVAAKYVKFTPRGSNYQWKGGFMFDVNKKDGKTEVRPKRTELFESVEENVEEADLGGVQIPENMALPDMTSIMNTGLTNANTDSDGTVYTNKTGEEIASTKEGKNIEQVKKDNLATEKVESKVTANKESRAEDTNSNLKEQMKIKGVGTTTDFSPLRSWYYEMFNKDPQKINTVAQELGLSNTKITDFIQNYEKSKEFRNLETYIEMLKCFS